MGEIRDVVLKGYARGKPHEIQTPGESKCTYRIFEVDTVEAIEGAPSSELEDKRVLVYPSQGARSSPSPEEQMLLLEAGDKDSNLSNYLEIFGTFEKADKKSPFAGRVSVWKVTSFEEGGSRYRPGKKEMLETLKTKE